MLNYRKQNAWNCFEFLPDAMLAVHLYSDRWSSMSMICVLWRDICWWNSTMKIMTLRIECDLYLWMDSMCYLVAPLVAARVLIDLYSDYSNCPWNLQITFLILWIRWKKTRSFPQWTRCMANWHQYTTFSVYALYLRALFCACYCCCCYDYYYWVCSLGVFVNTLEKLTTRLSLKTKQNLSKQQLNYYNYVILDWIFCTLKLYLFFS